MSGVQAWKGELENSESSAATHAMQQRAKRSYEFMTVIRCYISGTKDRIQKTLKSSKLTLLRFELMMRLRNNL